MLKTQSSFQHQISTGTLYIVPTPIGNLEDITIRAINTLKAVDMIAAEDTRNTKKLLNYFEIDNKLISYHEHNKQSRESRLLDALKEGSDIALVSDAGMPAISDPGYEIVKAAIEVDLPVVVLPGASAALCALVGSGLPANEFYFYGFLPRKKKDRDADMERLKSINATLLFYESPHRLLDTLEYLHEKLGNRRISVARELTKRFEEYIRGEILEVIKWTEEGTIKGEFCIVVEGNTESVSDIPVWWNELTIEKHVEHYINEDNMTSKEAIKQVAEVRKLPKREIYQAYHID
ncbi:16S rRNA (cytidine(1402)-2'-O)-methyltransferase [Aquibacillus halophilus]|uniref:Ribosomal RNA small subunit methyltransferase I n=1 Tax=Aquibacillus halophilus TaxID=930132 RepID=A0A6A8DPM0_9BACI|nr:16S rRNA (cytidine(1402)-2'-O)-methyltransferase [Aquibacillus halophilus]MRH45007.1 16S rRNA (cytidine(1402)-2'-O)-methyltransferase [Aquibacillus halophilus]